MDPVAVRRITRPATDQGHPSAGHTATAGRSCRITPDYMYDVAGRTNIPGISDRS